MKANKKSFAMLFAFFAVLIVIGFSAAVNYKEVVATTRIEEVYTLHKKGQYYMKVGKFDKAEKYFLEAISTMPDFRHMYIVLSNLYFYKRDYDRSIALLLKAMDMKPSEYSKPWLTKLTKGRLHYQIGECYEKKGEYEKALSSFQKAIELDPELVSPFLNMANIYGKQGKYDKAVALYRKIINYKLDIKKSYLVMLEEALNYYKEESEDYKTIKAQLENRITEQELAVYDENTMISEGIERNSLLFSAYKNMGIIFSRQLRLGESAEQFLKAIRIKSDAATFFNLAIVYAKMGERQNAVQSMESCIKLNPDSNRAKQFLYDLQY